VSNLLWLALGLLVWCKRKPMLKLKFELSDEDWKKVNRFIRKQDKLTGTGANYGAIGGGYTYQFTPTSLGVIVKVENCVTKASINLTDFDSW